MSDPFVVVHYIQLTEMDWNLTLEQAQLCPQETLFLEER